MRNPMYSAAAVLLGGLWLACAPAVADRLLFEIYPSGVYCNGKPMESQEPSEVFARVVVALGGPREPNVPVEVRLLPGGRYADLLWVLEGVEGSGHADTQIFAAASPHADDTQDPEMVELPSGAAVVVVDGGTLSFSLAGLPLVEIGGVEDLQVAAHGVMRLHPDKAFLVFAGEEEDGLTEVLDALRQSEAGKVFVLGKTVREVT